MSYPILIRSRVVLLPLAAALCSIASVNTSAATATDSATKLLTDLESACQPSEQIPPDIISGGEGGNNLLILEARSSAKSVNVSPGSDFCNNFTTTLTLIDRTNGNDPAARDAARDDVASEVTPDEVPALHTSLVQLSTDQIRNVSQHLRGHRYAQGNTAASSTVQHDLNSYYGGTAGDGLSSRFSLFVDGARVEGEQDATDREVGYDLETDHYTLGVDYRITDSLVAGVAYGNSDTSLIYSDPANQTDNITDHYILYASWYRDNFAVDTVLGFANGEFDTYRRVMGSTAEGSTDNKITYLSIAGSYDFVEGALTWGTFASFDYLDGEIDAFEETNGGGWEVAFSQQDVKSQIYAMGLHANYAISFGAGVLVPYVRADWRTELEDDRDLIVGQFVQDPSSSFTLAADELDDDWYQVSVGASAQFAHGIAVFADYEEVLDYEDTDLSTVTLGLRVEL